MGRESWQFSVASFQLKAFDFNLLLLTDHCILTTDHFLYPACRRIPLAIFFVLISIAAFLTVIYAYFFTDDPHEFLGTVLFYVITLLVIIAIIYITASTAGKFRTILTGFILSLIHI